MDEVTVFSDQEWMAVTSLAAAWTRKDDDEAEYLENLARAWRRVQDAREAMRIGFHTEGESGGDVVILRLAPDGRFGWSPDR